MLRSERVELILQRLHQQYPETPIPLDHSDPFTLLIAVLLSAQCTDKKVNEVTPALFAAGSTPAAMAQLEEEQILAFIRQLGLAKTKAKNVRRLAQILVTAYDGDVPQSFEELEALPVDTHIHRLAQRWGLSDGSSVARTEQDLKQLFPKEHWNRLHLQIIFWGREFCTARGCDGTVCSMCRELYPKRRRPVITRKP